MLKRRDHPLSSAGAGGRRGADLRAGRRLVHGAAHPRRHARGTFYGTVIEDQFVAVFNWPLGAALSFILLAVVLVILARGFAGAQERCVMADDAHPRMARPHLHLAAARLPLSADHHHGADVVQRLAASTSCRSSGRRHGTRSLSAATTSLIAATWNSVEIAVITTIIATVLGTAASLALFRYEFRGKKSCRRCCFRRSPFRG